MTGCIRGSDYRSEDSNLLTESAFARRVLSKVGGSLVYIERAKQFVDTEG